MITTVTKEVTFDCAHMLSDYNGLCNNLHGHTYKLQVTLTGELKDGMIMDFKEIKAMIQEAVMDKYDHALILNRKNPEAFEIELTKLAAKFDKKFMFINGRTTAENISYQIAADLCRLLSLDHGTRSPEPIIKLVKVRLYETPTSYAEVIL